MRIRELESDQKELIDKYEEAQKYWNQKYEQITEELNNQVSENREIVSKNK